MGQHAMLDKCDNKTWYRQVTQQATSNILTLLLVLVIIITLFYFTHLSIYLLNNITVFITT